MQSLWEPGECTGESHRFCGQRSELEGQIEFNFCIPYVTLNTNAWNELGIYDTKKSMIHILLDKKSNVCMIYWKLWKIT